MEEGVCDAILHAQALCERVHACALAQLAQHDAQARGRRLCERFQRLFRPLARIRFQRLKDALDGSVMGAKTFVDEGEMGDGIGGGRRG